MFPEVLENLSDCVVSWLMTLLIYCTDEIIRLLPLHLTKDYQEERQGPCKVDHIVSNGMV